MARAHGDPGAAGERDGRGEKADRAGAEHEHVVGGDDLREMRGVDADRERLGEHRQVEIERGGHGIEQTGRNAHERGETARRHAAEHTDGRAQIRLAGAAAGADATREQRLDDDRIAAGETAGRALETADDLMAEADGRRRRETGIVMKVGAANSAGVDADDGVRGRRGWCRHVAHLDRPRGDTVGGPHVSLRYHPPAAREIRGDAIGSAAADEVMDAIAEIFPRAR